MGLLRLQSHGNFTTHAQRLLSLHELINHLLSSMGAPKNHTGQRPAGMELKTRNGLGYFCLSPESRTEACGQQTRGNIFLFHITHNQIWNAQECPLSLQKLHPEQHAVVCMLAAKNACMGLDRICCSL